MASFMLPPIVNFACSCGIINPITKLYFCRHCLKLRCGFCVCHEVDSHFCSSCLENIPSSEAKHQKNRCNNCFNCPTCQHTLSARASTVTVPKKQDGSEKTGDSEEKPVTKKMYYLACLACRWTSRDVGIPDQTVATGTWPNSEYANQMRFSALIDHYQSIVLQEKQEKQDFWKRKAPKQHKYFSLADPTGLTVSMIRRQMGWVDKTPAKPKAISINPSEATEDVDELPESVFTEKLNLKNITTIKQRHAQPADQPYNINKLFPQRKSLWIKRSLRCRQCEHNVIKPEYHPGSIKYRIQLFASYHVPDVRLVKCEQPLKSGISNTVVLKLANPTIHDMTISIIELPSEDEESLLIEEVRKGFVRQSSLTSTPSLTSALSRQTSLTEEPRFVDKRTSAVLEYPDSSFLLHHRDDSAEFDEDIQIQHEDPPFVIWRKSNKASIKLEFTPNSDLVENDEVVIGFSLQYTYVNTVPNTSDKKDPQKHTLFARVYVKVGDIKSD